MQKPSQIYTGFRALGFVTNHVPLCVRYNISHKENYAVTCVDKAFHVYKCSKLAIISVSDNHPEPISCLAVDNLHVYTACGTSIQAYTRGRHVKYRYEGHQKTVNTLLPFGAHLISIDSSSHVIVWDIATQEIFLELQFDNTTFEVTTLVHPNTYVNKVLFGSRQGSLQLWNLRTNKQLYNFSGWGCAITVLEQAPAIDVIAVGLADGRIVLHNIKYDDTVMSFTQDWGPVTAISFRTDGHPIMVTGSTLGHIALWNLEEKKLQSELRDAHHSAVTGLKCLPSEPLMVTSSPDNSLKMWIFDMPDGGGRLLRSRSGHSAPPSTARYYDNQGHNIVSAGQDSVLHSFSTVHENQNKCLGRALHNRKAAKKQSGPDKYIRLMPPITAIASECSRDSDWDSIVACHRGQKSVTTWNYKRSTMGAHKLLHQRFRDEKQHKLTCALCVDVSLCGNFTVIGYSSGHVDQFNIQSGLHRCSYGNPTAHKGAVRGVAIDGLNQLTITAGADNVVRFWKFKSHQLIDLVKLDCQVSKILLHRESSMLAVCLDDFQTLILDIDTRRVVRRFSGHSSAITDLSFSPDSRWLVTSSMDCTVRTWDLPTGRMVDCFLVDKAVTSIALSPTCDFLLTTHVDDLGLYLWSNMTLYKHVNLRPLPADYEPIMMELPSSSTEFAGLAEAETTDNYEECEFKSPAQIADELVTLSLLPNSRWLSLINLDVIKQRNKPKEPPKVPKSAPFFLPTISGLTPKFAPEVEDIEEKKSKINVISSSLLPLSNFGKTLQAATETKSYDNVMRSLKEMGPSAVDSEFRRLSPEGGGSVDLMYDFLVFIDAALSTNRDFELIQAYLGLFLKLHGDTLSKEPKLVEAAEKLQQTQQKRWNNIQVLFTQSACLVNYLKSAAL